MNLNEKYKNRTPLQLHLDEIEDEMLYYCGDDTTKAFYCDDPADGSILHTHKVGDFPQTPPWQPYKPYNPAPADTKTFTYVPQYPKPIVPTEAVQLAIHVLRTLDLTKLTSDDKAAFELAVKVLQKANNG